MFLTGQAALADVILPSGIPNLSAIPSDLPLNGPSFLRRRASVRRSIRSAGVSPASCSTPGPSSASAMRSSWPGKSRFVLVLRYGHASRDAAQRAIRKFMAVRARPLGVILNDVDVHANGYRSYGYYGYSRPDGRQDGA
jgi:hypothetical protein